MVLTRSHLGCSEESVSLKQKAGTAGLRQRLLDRAQAMGWLECQEAAGQGQQCLGWEAVPSTRGTETPLGAPPLSCHHIHHSCEVSYDRPHNLFRPAKRDNHCKRLQRPELVHYSQQPCARQCNLYLDLVIFQVLVQLSQGWSEFMLTVHTVK